MKHLATIQTEFLREARQWDKMTLEDQRAYLRRHPKSKRRLTGRLGGPRGHAVGAGDERVINISRHPDGSNFRDAENEKKLVGGEFCDAHGETLTDKEVRRRYKEEKPVYIKTPQDMDEDQKECLGDLVLHDAKRYDVDLRNEQARAGFKKIMKLYKKYKGNLYVSEEDPTTVDADFEFIVTRTPEQKEAIQEFVAVDRPGPEKWHKLVDKKWLRKLRKTVKQAMIEWREEEKYGRGSSRD